MSDCVQMLPISIHLWAVLVQQWIEVFWNEISAKYNYNLKVNQTYLSCVSKLVHVSKIIPPSILVTMLCSSDFRNNLVNIWGNSDFLDKNKHYLPKSLVSAKPYPSPRLVPKEDGCTSYGQCSLDMNGYCSSGLVCFPTFPSVLSHFL